MNERFAQRMQDEKVRADSRIVAGLAAIYCSDKLHEDRAPLESDAVTLGVYGRRVPKLCGECAAHIRYAEQRRAYCPKDPKPFCAHCDTPCYRSQEAAWQRQMMRYAGPRSLLRGYALPGLKHALEGRRWRKTMARPPATTRTDDTRRGEEE